MPVPIMPVRIIAVLFAALWLVACAALPVAPGRASDPFAEIAPAYVKLVLGVGEHEDGYVDAYYGPAEWQAQVKAEKPSMAALKAEAERLIAAVEAVPTGRLSTLSRQRRDFLKAHLGAVRFRLDMIEGKRPPFLEEAQALFGARPNLRPLSDYDPTLERIERSLPGPGSLADRMEAWRAKYVIPKERLEPVFRAAIAECRRRTLQYIRLPANEAFTLEFVTGKSWSGYNWYKGQAQSLIQVNTDLPIYISRALDLGCHEGYPGHHAHNVLLEDRLVRGQGFVEFSVYPLFSPLSLIAEGTSNYGVDLAFPDEEKLNFERDVLYPLAGLDPSTAPALSAMNLAVKELAGARMTIAADYLDGRIDKETAIALTQKYQLVSRARAEQSIAFTEGYRTYVINYGLGEEMARRFIRNQASDPAGRWRAMERVLSRPTLPSDLLRFGPEPRGRGPHPPTDAVDR